MKRLASLELTVFALLALAAGAVQHALAARGSAAGVAVPLALLAANLGASIASHPAFRRNAPLLVFHVALLCVVALAAAGRLTYFKGHVELAVGEAFDGHVAQAESGPFHRLRVDRVRFENLGFTIRYAPGLRRGETRNLVRVLDAGGTAREQVIGDNEPLIAEGYRFYTSFNKGYALVFRWTPEGGGAPERGTVNLPAYPLHEHEQALEWRLPGSGARVWTMLEFATPPLDPARETTFRLPASHKVVMRMGERRWELSAGDRVALPGGTLAYEGLTTWMGYQVFRDWTMPWLVAACLTAVGALAWHFARKFSAAPWDA
jgi:cytochrome c biogenesis protein